MHSISFHHLPSNCSRRLLFREAPVIATIFWNFEAICHGISICPFLSWSKYWSALSDYHFFVTCIICYHGLDKKWVLHLLFIQHIPSLANHAFKRILNLSKCLTWHLVHPSNLLMICVRVSNVSINFMGYCTGGLPYPLKHQQKLLLQYLRSKLLSVLSRLLKIRMMGSLNWKCTKMPGLVPSISPKIMSSKFAIFSSAFSAVQMIIPFLIVHSWKTG